MDQELEQKKEDLLKKIKSNNLIVYVLLAAITYLGYYIRTRNIPILRDITTGKYVPLALDPHLFLRYSQYILENGKLMALDVMRNYPLGFPTAKEVPLLPNVIVYLYKFLHFFSSSVTIEYAHILYPAISFTVGLIFFFLLVRRVFNWQTALISSAFLAVLPTYLYRTMVGFSDKEALAMTFLFMAFYFYIRALQSNKSKHSLMWGAIAGVATGLTGLTWGGVTYIFLIIGIFAMSEIFLSKFKIKDFYTYLSWFLVTVPILLVSPRFTLLSLSTSMTSGIIFLVFLMALTDYIVFKKDYFKIKHKIAEKIPLGVAALIIALIIGVLFVTIFFDSTFIITKPQSLIDDIFTPLKDRWALTVAESHEPFIKSDWINGGFGWKYVLGMILGSVLLVYEAVKRIKYKWLITAGYTIFIFAFIFSRYDRNSILDGTSPLAKYLFLGSLIIFAAGIIILYIYSFYKDKDLFKEIMSIKKEYLFILAFFIIMIMGARRAIRLVFPFSPITAIMAGFLVSKSADYAKEFLKKDIYKKIAILLIVLIAFSAFYGFAKTTLNQAKYTGPSYNQQWQTAMGWTRENTPEDAVFGHWWDYGYWVQTGANRATVTDGGNAIGYWNHLMGRHALTGLSDQEALEFLYSHGVTHYLIISDEIGKYPAFSSIGSDATYDRYSWINTFNLDLKQSQETREGINYAYIGGTPLDDDFIYNDILFPKNSAAIIAFILPMKTIETINENNETVQSQTFEQPYAFMINNGKQHKVPLECIYIGNQEMAFPEKGLKGCLRIIPKIDGDQVNPIGSSLYLSERVRNGRVGQWYLLNKESPYFKLVYNDQNSMPLSLYNGRMIGPLKIWEINYPEGMEINQTYLETDFPDVSVTKI